MTRPADISLHALHTLHALEVLDTPTDERFQALAKQAAEACGAAIGLISLLDFHRQWFLGNAGLEGTTETTRDISFCQFTVLQSGPFVVPDTHVDPQFADNPLVIGAPHIRFYAGVPLEMSNGAKVGTLCVIDREPRVLQEGQLQALSVLASTVSDLLESRLTGATDSDNSPMYSHGPADPAAVDATATAAVFSVDAQDVIAAWSVPAQRLFGYNAAQAVGQPASMLIPPHLLQTEALILQRLRQGGTSHHLSWRRPLNGQDIAVAVTLITEFDAGGKVITVTHFVRERTPGADHPLSPIVNEPKAFNDW